MYLTPRRRIGLALVALIGGVIYAGLTLPQTPLPRLAIVGPIAYAIAILANAGAALLLMTTWRSSTARRSTLVLSLSFVAGAAMLALLMLVLPPMQNQTPVIAASAQAGIWLFVFYNLDAALGAFAYLLARRNDSKAMPSARFIVITAIGAGVVVLAEVAVVFVGSAYLPPLANGTVISGLIATGVGPCTTALLIVASLVMFGLHRSTIVDRALALSLLALAAGVGLYTMGGHRYSAAFYSSRVLLLLAALFVFVGAVQTLVISRGRLHEVEGELLREVDESRRQAKRIRAVWEIASLGEQLEGTRNEAILRIATAAVRPGIPMFGTLTHHDGNDLLIDAASWTEPAIAQLAAAAGLVAGATLAYETSMQSYLGIDGRKTLAWNDLSTFDGRGMRYEEMQFRSFVGTPVSIGRETYFLTFASTESTADEPFAEDDIAFVDVVAAFLSHQFAQERQFARIQFQVEHDALTGLENRVQFRKAVREAIADGGAFSVAFVNLDGFRHVNEREGNQIGDEVLVEVASTLAGVAPGDFVARMSADEFGIIVHDTPLSAYAAIFNTPFHTGDRDGLNTLGIGASIGASRYPFDGDSAEALMRRAEVALDVAKTRGGSTTLVFDGNMEAIIAESHLRVVELADAIAQDQLALVYQPTFELKTRRITGAEALVRWDHPVRGRLPPSEFISFAENNGMIAALSRWVFRRTVRDVSSIAALPPGFRVYFNLAALMLEDIPFIAELRAALDADPSLVGHIGIEVTETAAMQNVERSMNTIDLFRSWGITVAIDDFGTGYSSLSYLKQLTVDVIKIDRSFVMGLPDDERDGAITEMLLRITDRFGFATLAEGIETEEQAQWLLDHGCRYGQGYLIAKPFSFGELIGRLEIQRAA